MEAPASGMPVIGEDLFTLAVVDDIAISCDFDVMRSPLGFMRKDAKVGLDVEHEVVNARQRNR